MKVYEKIIVSADSEGSFIEESKLTVSRTEFFAQNPVRLACTQSQSEVYYLLDGLVYYAESDNQYLPVILTGMRPTEIFGENWKEFYTAVK